MKIIWMNYTPFWDVQVKKMNEYEEFHRVKRELIGKLQSIEDGSCMNSLCDDCLESIRVKDQMKNIKALAKQLEALRKGLAKGEQ
jgi:metal-responsive CopG/Arc/MetJ family transcriptional regulator